MLANRVFHCLMTWTPISSWCFSSAISPHAAGSVYLTLLRIPECELIMPHGITVPSHYNDRSSMSTGMAKCLIWSKFGWGHSSDKDWRFYWSEVVKHGVSLEIWQRDPFLSGTWQRRVPLVKHWLQRHFLLNVFLLLKDMQGHMPLCDSHCITF